MRRYITPGLFIFLLSLTSSAGLHGGAYQILGSLERSLGLDHDVEPGYVEFELTSKPEVSSRRTRKANTRKLREKARRDKANERAKSLRARRPRPERRPRPKRAREPQPKQLLARARSRPATDVTPHAVTQRSSDPNVETPDNPRFIAEHNRRVEEETVARVRSLTRDDPEPQSGGPTAGRHRPGRQQSEEEPGTRAEDPEHALGDKDEGNQLAASDKPQPKNSAPAAGESGRPVPPARATPASRGGVPEEGVLVKDATGSYRLVVRPRRPRGRGGGDTGGSARKGSRARRAKGLAGGTGVAQGDDRLNLTWSRFELAMGANELREQRKAYARRMKAKGRGGSRIRRWRQFRAAVENHVHAIKPGTHTALNTAASPFAAYLAAVHRRLHPQFAEGFLGSLPAGSGPFSDPTLQTRLEIAFNRDGSVHRITIVKTSGLLPFDYGAFDAVMRGQPYPEAPPQILSGDGRVYVRWGFYRNHRQCGTFNAEPFILDSPPGTPKSKHPPFRDPGSEPEPHPRQDPPDSQMGYRARASGQHKLAALISIHPGGAGRPNPLRGHDVR
ncbi:MAG: TonB C-terminal domain-containing protein [Proteobacteria bacterium]|nr:TonB C-terminal domain-containing protein [Pseudomonadota bacterium]